MTWVRNDLGINDRLPHWIPFFFFSKKGIHYTINDYNVFDVRIYQPEKVISLLRVDKSLCEPKLKSITVLLFTLCLAFYVQSMLSLLP